MKSRQVLTLWLWVPVAVTCSVLVLIMLHMEGLGLAGNEPMLALARKLGFSVEAVPPDGTVLRVLRRLQPAPLPQRPDDSP